MGLLVPTQQIHGNNGRFDCQDAGNIVLVSLLHGNKQTLFRYNQSGFPADLGNRQCLEENTPFKQTHGTGLDVDDILVGPNP